MDEIASLQRFGLTPKQSDLPEIRALLAEQTEAESREQGDGDTLLMRLACVQLFNAGSVEDSLAIWRARMASFDAGASIDLYLLCGAGLDKTIEYLDRLAAPEARAAATRLRDAKAKGSFDTFTVEGARTANAARYVL